MAACLTFVLACKKEKTQSMEENQPPVAKKIAKELTLHNDTRVDNYYWMNDRTDQAVLDYLTEENDYY